MVQVGNTFETMAEARTAITRFLLDAGQSYKVYKGDSNRYILICKTKSDCSFKIRATHSKKREAALITIVEPHSCSPIVHFENKHASAVSYLMNRHRASVVNNKVITLGNLEILYIE